MAVVFDKALQAHLRGQHFFVETVGIGDRKEHGAVARNGL